VADSATTELRGDNKPLKESLKESEKLFSEWGVAVKTAVVQVGLQVATSFASAFAGAIQGGLSDAMRTISIQTNLDAALLPLGDAAEEVGEKISKLSSEIHALTQFDDKQANTAATMMVGFDGIAQHIDRLLPLTADLAQRFGTDMPAQAQRLAKAIAEPREGMNALKEMGVVLSAEQKKLMTTMLDAGKTAEVQALLIGELEKRFAGAAEAAGGELPARLANLNKAWDDIKETLATGLIPVMEDWMPLVETIADFLKEVLLPAITDVTDEFNLMSDAVDDNSAAMKRLEEENQVQWFTSLKEGWNNFWGYLKLGWTDIFNDIADGIVENITVPLYEALEQVGLMSEATSDKLINTARSNIKEMKRQADELRESLQKSYDATADDRREVIEERRARRERVRQPAESMADESAGKPISLRDRQQENIMMGVLAAPEEAVKVEVELPEKFTGGIEGLLDLNRRISGAAGGMSDGERAAKAIKEANAAAAELAKRGNEFLEGVKVAAQATVDRLDKVIEGLPFVGALR
jgi:hypothetical protein